MGMIENMDAEQRAQAEEVLAKIAAGTEMTVEMFEMKDMADVLNRKLQKIEGKKNRQATLVDIDEVKAEIKRVEDRIMQRLDNIFGDQVLVNGQWMKVKGIYRGHNEGGDNGE